MPYYVPQLNSVRLIGHVGRSPRLKPDEQTATFALCVTRRWTDKETGESHEEMDWFDVLCRGSAAKFAIEGGIQKNDVIWITGQLRVNRRRCEDLKIRAFPYVLVSKRPVMIGHMDTEPPLTKESDDFDVTPEPGRFDYSMADY